MDHDGLPVVWQEGGLKDIKTYQTVAEMFSIGTQPSQSVRVPCKARGVPGIHNSENAYIDIPANPIHGMVLKCSHPGKSIVCNIQKVHILR